MPIDHILALLIEERDKLNRAIEALRRNRYQTTGPSEEGCCRECGPCRRCCRANSFTEASHAHCRRTQSPITSNESRSGRSGRRTRVSRRLRLANGTLDRLVQLGSYFILNESSNDAEIFGSFPPQALPALVFRALSHTSQETIRKAVGLPRPTFHLNHKPCSHTPGSFVRRRIERTRTSKRLLVGQWEVHPLFRYEIRVVPKHDIYLMRIVYWAGAGIAHLNFQGLRSCLAHGR